MNTQTEQQYLHKIRTISNYRQFTTQRVVRIPFPEVDGTETKKDYTLLPYQRVLVKVQDDGFCIVPLNHPDFSVPVHIDVLREKYKLEPVEYDPSAFAEVLEKGTEVSIRRNDVEILLSVFFSFTKGIESRNYRREIVQIKEPEVMLESWGVTVVNDALFGMSVMPIALTPKEKKEIEAFILSGISDRWEFDERAFSEKISGH